MSDPDAPSRADPKYQEWFIAVISRINFSRRHWVVVNIPGSDVSKGNVAAPYMGPGPPPKTGDRCMPDLVNTVRTSQIRLQLIQTTCKDSSGSL